MNNHWENRYQAGGNSGAGSYGEYAKHKSEVINNYINKFEIKTISDFGCGDGNQISTIFGFEKYCGYDISPYIIEKCRGLYKDNDKIKFVNQINEISNADLCLSLDVIYHIIDENDYANYLENLFDKSNKYVLIFSSNHNDNNHNSDHIFHRKFTDWVDENKKNFKLIDEVENFLQTSAKFYLFERN